MESTKYLIIAALTSQVLAAGVLPGVVNIEVCGTPVYGVSPLCSNRPVNEKTGFTANEFRTALSKFIEGGAAADQFLYFIVGEIITSTGNLKVDQSKGLMHLS